MANRFLSNLRINDAYTFPDNDGSVGQAIVTDGAGNLTFGSVAAASADSAESTHLNVKNTSGASIAKGTPVYVTGSVGNTDKLEIAPADASNASHMPAIGLLESTLANNGEGFVVQGGLLKGLVTDTIDGSSSTANDTVYVKAGGGLTLTKPTGSTNFIQNIAKVARVHSSNGSLIVSSILRTNDVPNLPEGKIWVGDGNTTVSTIVHLDELNGRVGIGTDSPARDFHLHRDTLPDIHITNSASGAALTDGATLTLADLDFLINNREAGNLRLSTSGTERMRITSGGDISFRDTSTNEAFYWDASTARLGIGTDSPSTKLEVEGDTRINGSLLVNGGYLTKELNTPYFTNGVANLACNIQLGNNNFWGYIEVHITGAYSSQNTPGALIARYAVGTVLNNLIYANDREIIAADGPIKTNISLGNFQWDSGTSQYVIPISHIVSSGNGYSVLIKMFTHDSGAATVMPSLSISSLYTLTALPRLYKNINDRLGIGTASPSFKLDVLGDSKIKYQSGATNNNAPSSLILSNTTTGAHAEGVGSSLQFEFNNTSGGFAGAKISSEANADANGSDLVFYPRYYGYSEAMRITSGGNVGIKGTGTKLGWERASDNSANIVYLTKNEDLGVNGNAKLHGYDGIIFSTEGSETPKMTIDSSGNVGIGTANVSNKLSLSGNGQNWITSPAIKMWDSYNSKGWYVGSANNNTAGDFYIRSVTAENLYPVSANQEFTIKQSGNVGIGTTSPASKLHIIGNASIGTTGAASSSGLLVGGKGAFGNYVGSGDFGAAYNISLAAGITAKGINMGYNATADAGFIGVVHNGTGWKNLLLQPIAGNVGIGTTSPGYKLHVAGNSFIDATSASATLTLGRYSGQPTIKAGTDDSGYLIIDSSGGILGLNWYSSDNIAIAAGGGNVGIGGTNPSSKLEVISSVDSVAKFRSTAANSNVNIGDASSTTSYSSVIFNTNSGLGQIWKAGTAYSSWGGVSALNIYTSNGPIAFHPNTNTNAMFLSTSGNVGIGTTAPTQKLNVVNDNTGTWTAKFTNNTNNVYLSVNDANNYGIYVSGETKNYFSGNVGIGTTSPSAKLQANGSIRSHFDSTRYAQLESNASGGVIKGVGGNGFFIRSYGESYFNGGNVGIGVTSPGHKLHVAGATYIEHQGTNWNEITPGVNRGSLHIDPVGNGADNTGGAITFGASDAGAGATAMAGIYTRSDGSYGTKMYFATTNSYAAGSRTSMFIGADGKVGIGTVSPSSMLHLESASSPNLRIKDTTQGVTLLVLSQDSDAHIGTYSNHPLVFDTNSAERMSISSGGSVTANVDMRAPIFYDSDNTSYYLHPASTSRINVIDYSQLKSPSSSNNGSFVNHSDWGTLHQTDSGYIQLGPANSSWAHIYTDRPAFYFNKNLYINNVQVQLVDATDIRYRGTINNQDWNTYIDGTEAGWYGVNNATGSNRPSAYTYGTELNFSISGANKFQLYAPHNATDGNGIWARTGWSNDYDAWREFVMFGQGPSSGGDLRAPIFYDSNDTNYYVDPASTASLNAVHTTRIGVNRTSSSSSRHGISLYGGYTTGEPTYGILFTGTSLGTHGAVTGDWATYFTMSSSTNRGWIFRNVTTGNVASINNAGTAHFNGDVVASCSSDERLKDNKKNIENALKKVESLNGVEFDWNDKQDVYEGHDIGVIAQEVEKVLPEIVNTRDNGYKAVKYEKLVPLLIEAIKELSNEIKELKNK